MCFGKSDLITHYQSQAAADAANYVPQQPTQPTQQPPQPTVQQAQLNATQSTLQPSTGIKEPFHP